MKKVVAFAVLILCITPMIAQASTIPPIAVLTSTPNQNWFYNAEIIYFSSGNSTDQDGYIIESKLYFNGTYVGGSSYTFNYPFCITLYGTAESGCYELASGATTVSVTLEVKDNHGNTDSVTQTYTIQEHKGRKYFVTDHLGSVRATVNRDGNVLGYSDYYPFGLEMRSNNTANPNDNYKFTGYEQDDEAGLDLYHANARGYDPVIARFLQIDPLADQFPGWTPYHYVHNNPLNLVDPTGMAACDPPDECGSGFFNYVMGLIGQGNNQRESDGVSVQLSLETTAVVGLNEITKDHLNEGIDNSVPALETVSGVAEATELGAAALAGPTGGASVPTMTVAGAIDIGADVTAGGLLALQSYINGSDDYSAANSKFLEAGTSVFLNEAFSSASKAVVRETSQNVAPAFRSPATGRFVSNLAGYSAAYTAPAAVTLAIVKTLFPDN